MMGKVGPPDPAHLFATVVSWSTVRVVGVQMDICVSKQAQVQKRAVSQIIALVWLNGVLVTWANSNTEYRSGTGRTGETIWVSLL